MTKVKLEDNKFIKELYAKFDEFKRNISNEVQEIKEMIETLKEVNNEKHTITEYDVEIAWVKFRLDYLTGVKKISSERFYFLKKYMDNIDLKDIPFELKYYIKEENKNESN
jgi:hypothetical protein